MLFIAFHATSCRSIESYHSSTDPSKLKHNPYDYSHLDPDPVIDTFQVKNNYSYGPHCKVFDLVETSGMHETTHMLVCYANPDQPKTTAVLGLFVDYNGAIGVVFRGDHLKESLKLESSTFKMDFKFDNNRTTTDLWHSHKDWGWAFSINEINRFLLMADRIALFHKVAISIPTETKDIKNIVDTVNIAGGRYAKYHFETAAIGNAQARMNLAKNFDTKTSPKSQVTVERLQKLSR